MQDCLGIRINTQTALIFTDRVEWHSNVRVVWFQVSTVVIVFAGEACADI